MLFRGLSVIDNLYLAAAASPAAAVARCGRARTTRRSQAARELAHAVRLDTVADRWSPISPTASSGSWRSAWRSPARRASSCSTSRRRACRRGERRELVQILGALPRHIGFIIIEHDLDVALRVVERVTVMHSAKIFKHGTPAEIESDPDVQRIYLGDRHG